MTELLGIESDDLERRSGIPKEAKCLSNLVKTA